MHISQSAAEWIVSMHFSRWVLLTAILLLVILGFFLPPVSIILMTAPIILAPLKAAGFDLVWFGSHHDHRHGDGTDPSAGRAQHLRHQEHRSRHSSLSDVIWGVLPFVVLMALAVAVLCSRRRSPSGCPTS